MSNMHPNKEEFSGPGRKDTRDCLPAILFKKVAYLVSFRMKHNFTGFGGDGTSV